MKGFKEHLTEAKNKPVVFTFGRFNPITKGHGELIDFVVKKARGGEGMIFTSQSNDVKKNPIPYKDKIKFLKKLFPKASIQDNPKLKTPFQILEWLSDQGYKDVTMVVGGDRVVEFEKKIRPYVDQKDPNKPHYNFDKFEVVNSGERKQGVSGTDMRKHVENDDYKSFKAGAPKGAADKIIKDLFKSVKVGMGIKEYLEIGTDETTKEYKKKTPGEVNEGALKDLLKSIIGKKTMHSFNRAVHEKKYKQALTLYHSMIQQYNKHPDANKQDGTLVTNPKGLALSRAAEMVGISIKELKKVLDKKTRYESFDGFNKTKV
jgi:nicotinamide mononucleotide adenylyltransferase